MDAVQLEIVEVLSQNDLAWRRRDLLGGPRVYAAVQLDSLDSYESTSDDGPAFKSEKGPPPWAIGFSRQFKKDTAALDRKLMGRVLEALEEISDFKLPFEIRGDSFKPLTGELGGCWRYRLGDWRLVLRPVVSSARIDALTLAARGSVYD